jgi:serine phosphatase RsbU (regulator of sigma subunit)
MKKRVEGNGSDLPIDWGVAISKLPGHTECGDQFVVKAFDEGVLIGVVDGLGHGSEAAIAAKAAVLTLGNHARESVISLINLCHKELRKTRGAVMSLVSLNTGNNTLTWIAVGNVSAVLRRIDTQTIPMREYVLMGRGVVGDRLPVLRASVMPIMRGDMLILATDGIRETFASETVSWGSPQQIADDILARHAKGSDEALVLVIRYKGGRQ